MILSIQLLYYLVRAILVITAGMTLADASHLKRYTSALFWGLYALVFLVGEKLSPVWIGAGVVIMALIAGFNGVGAGGHQARTAEQYLASAKRLGNKLFMPALGIPLITVIGTLSASSLFVGGLALINPKNATLVSLGLACVISFALACWLTKESPVQGIRESHRLTDALGWALVLPQMLGMLGLVFSDAGVGKAVTFVTTGYINMDVRFVAVLVYAVGMALFTVVMGNGFAAFPVMTGGVGVPILVGIYHGNPAVIRAQVPTALTLLLVNVLLLNF